MLIGIDASRANLKYKSGTEWYSYYLIRELAKIDSQNKYLLYTDRPLTDGLADLTEETDLAQPKPVIDKHGRQTIKSPYNNFQGKIIRSLPFFWTQLSLSLAMLVNPPDLLFIPAHTLPLLHPQRSVVTIHDIGFIKQQQLYSHEQIGPLSRFWRRQLNRLVKIFTGGHYSANVFDYHNWSTKFALRQAKRIITVSNFSKQEILATYHTPAQKIKVIYHGYNDRLYRKINDQIKISRVLKKYDIRGPYIFYVGRLEKKKNISALVEAYALMREKHKFIKHKLVLVGSAGLGFDEVKYVIQEYNLDNEVIITGWVPEEDMPYIFNGATVLFFPSLYEGFGIPLLQAMACGLPIIASRLASIPEIVQDAAWLINPYDKKEMANALAEFIANPSLRQEYIKRGLARVNNFSLRRCAEQTLDFLTLA